jgi:RNA polymerase sigma factor (sigma-70 family)
MDAKLTPDWAMAQDDRSVAESFARDGARLRAFIRRRVPDPADAEDILQDVFHELVEAARLLQPIEQVGAWLFRVARNRIIDRFRRRRSERSVPRSAAAGAQFGEQSGELSGEVTAESLEDLLPAPDAGPEAAYARRVLLEELADALDELAPAQRSVFIAHELDGRSFKELAESSGESLNTLLSRKRYAVLHLRRRLQAIHDEFDEP